VEKERYTRERFDSSFLKRIESSVLNLFKLLKKFDLNVKAVFPKLIITIWYKAKFLKLFFEPQN